MADIPVVPNRIAPNKLSVMPAVDWNDTQAGRTLVHKPTTLVVIRRGGYEGEGPHVAENVELDLAGLLALADAVHQEINRILSEGS